MRSSPPLEDAPPGTDRRTRGRRTFVSLLAGASVATLADCTGDDVDTLVWDATESLTAADSDDPAVASDNYAALDETNSNCEDDDRGFSWNVHLEGRP